jgi:hypothetical protein
MFLKGDISIFSPGRFSEIVAILTAPAVQCTLLMVLSDLYSILPCSTMDGALFIQKINSYRLINHKL